MGWPRSAAALDPRKLLTQYGHDVWQVEDGLPQNTIKAIHQTRDGYLWLGTEEGLVRFDGIRFTVFDSVSTPAMQVSYVNAFFEDESGRLWIGTNGGGLLAHQHGRFTAHGLRDNPSLLVTAIARNGAQGLWLGTSLGLLQAGAGGALGVHPRNDELSVTGVIVALTDRQGTLWMGTRTKGLVSLRDGEIRRHTTANGLTDDQVWSLAEGADGGLWIGTDKGLDRLAPDGTLTSVLAGEAIRALLEDRDHGLWVGTNDHGLKRLHGGRWATYGTAEGLSASAVVSLHEDREGSLWIGTNGGGLNRLRDGAVTTLSVEEGLSSAHVRAVYEHPDGTLWIGTRGGGANRVEDGRVSSLTTADGLSEDAVVSFGAGQDGSVWLGTVRGGLNRWKDGRVEAFGEARGLPHPSAFALLGRPDGSLWIGHRGGGLSRFQGGRFFRYGPAEGLDNLYVWSIVEGRGGTLWLGTAGGLYTHSGGRFERVIRDAAIHPVYVDGEGVVWAGTSTHGLFRWKDGRAAAIGRRQGLFDDMVAGILEDRHGNLWMSCNKGIFSVSKRQLHDAADGRIPRVVSVAYDGSDGMKSQECSYGSSWKTADGRLWFPTIRGAVVVDPDRLRRNMVPPPVVIEDVVGNGARLSGAPGEPLEVAPGEGRLHFEYTALSLVAPKKVRFAYRLEGLDKDWTDGGGTRQASYANLGPGHYTFRVKACNNDGVWNETGAAVRVHLQPYFHQTPWFYALCVAGVVAAGWQGHRIRLRRLLAVERVRTRIAADLHDDVGSGLSQIAILTGVARTQIEGGGARAPESLAQIAGTAEELVDSMSDIVWAMNPGSDHLGDLVHRMRRFATEVFGARNIAFTILAEGLDEARKVDPDLRRHAYLLFKEAVNNAARHSGCARVEVVVEATQNRLLLKVTDDGKGFDAAARGGGHGLGTMAARANELGGRLEIDSRPGEGTTVRAELPMSRRRAKSRGPA